ncbi:MAG: YlxR family protein [SAR202 cluster bacterium]|nr:YlxR family protein [SAR202 cluster bacterium]|tara:strand:+ start:4632 stop:4838 length:207 start_codon:yes stop_codon:yes gene_type:complete
MIRLASVDGQVKVDVEARLDGRGIYICSSKGCRLSELEAGKLSYSLKTVVTKENTAAIREQLRTSFKE